MIPSALLLWALLALCVIGVRHFRRTGNKIGYWGMLLLAVVMAGFAVFLTIVTILFLSGPPLVW